MTGLVIIMLSNQAMTMKNALFITLGANVGTCVVALIGIIGTNVNSKRAAIIHLTFNLLGCIIFTPILWIFTDEIIYLLRGITSKEGIQIALFHLFFNCITAIITTPLIKYLVNFSKFVIKDKKVNIEEKLLGEEEDDGDILRNGTIFSSLDLNNKDNDKEKIKEEYNINNTDEEKGEINEEGKNTMLTNVKSS